MKKKGNLASMAVLAIGSSMVLGLVYGTEVVVLSKMFGAFAPLYSAHPMNLGAQIVEQLHKYMLMGFSVGILFSALPLVAVAAPVAVGVIRKGLSSR